MNWTSYWILENSEAIDKKRARRTAGVILIVSLCVICFLIGMVVGLSMK